MNIPIPRPEFLHTLASTVIAITAFWATMPLAASQSTTGDESSLVRDWLDQSAAFYAEHDELKRPANWGWRHLARVQRFLDGRTIGGTLPTAADRVRAWEVARTRRAVSGKGKPGIRWTSIGPPNVSGRIVDLKFHPTNPQLVYAAAASGGLWISSDGGNTWRTTTDELPSLAIGAVCVLPTDPNVVLVATGEGINWSYVVYGVGIWKSTDEGETWNPTSLTHKITDNHGFHVMEANPITGTILAGANDGLWRSTDQGDTWVRVRTGGDYYDVKWKPGSANRVYATKGNAPSGNGILVSNTDGLTWALTGSGLPPSSLISKTKLAVTPADPSVIYAHFGNSQGIVGIYRSLDDGGIWTPRNTTQNISGGQGAYAVTIAVDPDDPERIIAGGIALYLSTDGGLTLTETGGGNPLGDKDSVHVDQHAIAWEPGSTSNVWIGSDGGPWRSIDNGDTWSPRRDGLVTTQFYDVCLDPNDPAFIMGGTQDNGLPWVEEAGAPWFPSTLLADGLACHVEPLSPKTIHSEWQFGGHVRSMDRGWSWDSTVNGLTGGSIAFAPLDLDPNYPGHLYTATLDGVFRTTNNQDLWMHVALHSPTWISISPVDGDIIWTTGDFAGNPPVRFTTDDGSTWIFAQSYGFAVGNETKILAHPKDPGAAFVTFAGYSGVAHVARTTDFGQSWENVSGNFPPDPANTMAIDPIDPKHWFVGTDTGVWHSANEGVNWTPYRTGFPKVLVYDLEIHRSARKLVACTYGRGIWAIDLPVARSSQAPNPGK